MNTGVEVDYWTKTIEVLQADDNPLITKPKLTEKLLRKPPFRFLHDVISAVQSATSFAQGLFNETESNAKEIKDRSTKLTYLQKIVDVVGICLDKPLNVKPAKIIAGQEPEQTNRFLQALAHVAQTGDGRQAVQVVLGSNISKEDPCPKSGTDTSVRVESMVTDIPDNSNKNEGQQQQCHSALDLQRTSVPVASNEGYGNFDVPPVKGQLASEVVQSLKLQDAEIKSNGLQSKSHDGVQLKLVRPQSAKKAPPRLISQQHSRQIKEVSTKVVEEPPVVTLTEEKNIAEEENIIEVAMEPNRFSDQTTGQQQGILVEDMLAAGQKLQDQLSNSNSAFEDALPTGIVLKRVAKGQEVAPQKSLDVEQLKHQVQHLCLSINPLGKCLDFLEENLENMNLELAYWTQEQKTFNQSQNIVGEGKKYEVQNIHSQINRVDSNIAHLIERNNALKTQFQKGEQTIARLLQMSVVGM